MKDWVISWWLKPSSTNTWVNLPSSRNYIWREIRQWDTGPRGHALWRKAMLPSAFLCVFLAKPIISIKIKFWVHLNNGRPLSSLIHFGSWVYTIMTVLFHINRSIKLISELFGIPCRLLRLLWHISSFISIGHLVRINGRKTQLLLQLFLADYFNLLRLFLLTHEWRRLLIMQTWSPRIGA